ncbi:periodic tryptophan protein 2 homolog [Branchiostoma floridae x Branchiostoma belcheri]
MARRRLEAALDAGREISSPELDPFSKLSVLSHIPVQRELAGAYSLQFSLTGNQLAVGFGNGAVQLYNPENGEMTLALKKGSSRRGLAVMSLCYHPLDNGIILEAGADGNIGCWQLETSMCTHSLQEDKNEINAMDFNLDGAVFATVGKDRHIRMYDSKTFELLQTLEAPNPLIEDVQPTSGHSRRIYAIKFHPTDNYMFITAGWDNSLKIWDRRTKGGAKRVIGGPHVCGPALDIKDNKVLTGSWVAKDSLQLWHFQERSLLQTIPFPSGKGGEFLYCAQFCDHDVVLAGGSGTNSAQAIQMKNENVLGAVDGGGKAVQTLDAIRGGRLLAVGGLGPQITVGKLE